MPNVFNHSCLLFPFNLGLPCVLIRDHRPAPGGEDATSKATLGKCQNDIFKLQTLRLRIEEIYAGNLKEIEHGGDDENKAS